jgi:ribonuclease HII
MGSVEAAMWPGTMLGGPWAWSDDGWNCDEVNLPTLVGVDEAGRGPLAGPVSVAAVVFSPAVLVRAPAWLSELDDSKRLGESAREGLFHLIMEAATAWSIVHVHAGHIDAVNILKATFHGMSLAVETALGLAPSIIAGGPACSVSQGVCAADWYRDDVGPEPLVGAHVRSWTGAPRTSGRGVVCLVDGNKRFKAPGSRAADFLQRPVVKGDALSHHIAAASILAKVSRDAVMVRLDTLFPAYGFARHKGYPTAQHRAALAVSGPCVHHRRTFRGARGPVQ